ncbi:similar to Saccharomyces cerevisiae YHL044W Putative integral membrane protein, member of DUP240 gene family [Maudiozyma barnettii]|uniref:Similar to Saccharomyces cerevisiae YHL044W Putative integral membrane protein, member of DUP240 gene family n=1 Tax=Maudiozyma barnettii TaxID=61262 RepID=A0A8H2VJI4_9SACH|nr:uncharacterized protein KABA2_10S00132 [Kazachstania barnettii]CAB4256485.1 similar to Saccharomyces cerevisiae YHL044W Putative integral membrane protein, member of DUP240 gene family [Kazachstania barnettii]CAD1785589.1 similar to Saccharomyces cerevisiae YHL044W Putative integral membrane protein, member of DUP240 gene family [Kazachstania barnettii]
MSELPLYTPVATTTQAQDIKNQPISTNDEQFMSIYLPFKVFNSKFRFFWYHYWTPLINKLLTVSFVGFFTTCFIVSPRVSVILPTVLLSICIVIVAILTGCNTFGIGDRLSLLDFNAKKAFLTDVINEAPDYRIKRWNIIAARMNKFLYDEEIFPNYYTLYDGRDCLNMYNFLVASLKPSGFHGALQQFFGFSKALTNSNESSSVRDVDEITVDLLTGLVVRAQEVIRTSIENL